MKEKIEKTKQKVKKWWIENKETVGLVTLMTLSFIGGIGISNVLNSSGSSINIDDNHKNIKIPTNMLCKNNLDIPTDWDHDSYDVSDYWTEQEGSSIMIVNAPISKLGDYGKDLIDFCGAKETGFADMIVGFDTNEPD